MTHSNLTVEVQGTHILVFLRGTCFKAKYRKQEAPWLGVEEFGPDDPGAAITLSEFRSLAWAAANDTAHQLGWIKSCDELHGQRKGLDRVWITNPQFDVRHLSGSAGEHWCMRALVYAPSAYRHRLRSRCFMSK